MSLRVAKELLQKYQSPNPQFYYYLDGDEEVSAGQEWGQISLGMAAATWHLLRNLFTLLLGQSGKARGKLGKPS